MKYLPELKEKIIQEVAESGKVTAVAKKHGIPVTTIHTWINKPNHKDPKNELKKLRKEVLDQKLKIDILEDMLKKTHVLWAND